MNTYELVQYYANLLILQYIGKPKAFATIETQVRPVIMPQTSVQTLTFSAEPDAGSLTLSWDENTLGPFAFNDTAGDIETALQAYAPDATVTGSFAEGFTFTFTDEVAPAALIEVVSSSLEDGGDDVQITVTETDLTLPLAVQNAFNLIGDDLAVGAQLDILAKYVGVNRTGQGFSTQITLDDAELLNLIKFAIIKNNSGSSLATITGLLYQFFGTDVQVIDYTNMFMSFVISEEIATDDFLQLVITEGLLPVPMAVGYDIIIAPAEIAFGFDGVPDTLGFGDSTDPDVGGILSSVYDI